MGRNRGPSWTASNWSNCWAVPRSSTARPSVKTSAQADLWAIEPRAQFGHHLFMERSSLPNQLRAIRGPGLSCAFLGRGQQVQQRLCAHEVHLRPQGVRRHRKALAVARIQAFLQLSEQPRSTFQVYPGIFLHTCLVALAEALEVLQDDVPCFHDAKVDTPGTAHTFVAPPPRSWPPLEPSSSRTTI